MDFQFKTNRKGNDLAISMTGRLDTLSATDFAKEVKVIIAQPFSSAVLDVAELSYISSSGLRCFVELFKGCKAKGAAFSITGIQPAVREIFDLTGFSKIFGLK